MKKENTNIRLVYAVLLGGAFIAVPQYSVTLITDDGKHYILLKAFIGIFYAIYIYIVQWVLYRKK